MEMPSIETLIEGDYLYLPDPKTQPDDNYWQSIADEVRNEMKFVWNNYKKRCFGSDGFDPISGNCGAYSLEIFLIDSLDTLFIMDMKLEFSDAVNYV